MYLHGELRRSRAQLSDLCRAAKELKETPERLRRSLISLDDEEALVEVARRSYSHLERLWRRLCCVSVAVTAFGSCTYGTKRPVNGSVKRSTARTSLGIRVLDRGRRGCGRSRSPRRPRVKEHRLVRVPARPPGRGNPDRGWGGHGCRSCVRTVRQCGDRLRLFPNPGAHRDADRAGPRRFAGACRDRGRSSRPPSIYNREEEPVQRGAGTEPGRASEAAGRSGGSHLMPGRRMLGLWLRLTRLPPNHRRGLLVDRDIRAAAHAG